VILVPPPQHNPVIHTTSPTRDADVTDQLCRAEYYRRFSRTPTTFHRSVFILCSQTMCTVTTILFPSTSPFPNPKFLSLVTQPGKADGYKESSEEARREHATDAETIGATNDWSGQKRVQPNSSTPDKPKGPATVGDDHGVPSQRRRREGVRGAPRLLIEAHGDEREAASALPNATRHPTNAAPSTATAHQSARSSAMLTSRPHHLRGGSRARGGRPRRGQGGTRGRARSYRARARSQGRELTPTIPTSPTRHPSAISSATPRPRHTSPPRRRRRSTQTPTARMRLRRTTASSASLKCGTGERGATEEPQEVINATPNVGCNVSHADEDTTSRSEPSMVANMPLPPQRRGGTHALELDIPFTMVTATHRRTMTPT
jgi:hypothetical protein